MKYRSAPSWVLTLALLAGAESGCKRHKSSGSLASGKIRFEGAAVALSPGEHWKQARPEQNSAEGSGWGKLCLPVLEGEGENQGGAIEVYVAPGDTSSPKARATKVRAIIEPQAEVLKTSLKEEHFKTETGIAGVHLSYNTKMEANARKWLNRRHFYFVRNNKGISVAVSYVVAANRDQETVHEMILKTLVLD